MYTEKVRIYPNKTQKELIDKILKYSCILYNKLYDIHEYNYWMYGKSTSRFQLDKYSHDVCYGFDITLPAVVRQYVCYRLDNSFQRFFKEVSRFPKHKPFRKFRSFGTLLVGSCGNHVLYNSRNPRNSKIQIARFGKFRARFTRPICGKPTMIVIKKMSSGIYYAFVQIDGSTPRKEIDLSARQNVIALDLGINKFLTDHLGNYVPQPRFVEYNEKRIRSERRKLSRMKKGSHNYKKQRYKLAKMHERVRNIRRDWQFKLAYFLVTNYKSIVCEDLHVSDMLKKKDGRRWMKKLRRLLKGCAFSQFLIILQHMCNKYNCQLIKVDSTNTSQLCSNCGAMVIKKPGQHHNCPHCGLQADRDVNAARNIYERGMGQKFSVWTTGGAPAPLMLVNRITVPGT